MACPEWPQDKECSGRSFASFNPGLIHKSANGEYLKSIAYGTNEKQAGSLCYFTLSRRRGGYEVMVFTA
jgi:hypothetical protein